MRSACKTLLLPTLLLPTLLLPTPSRAEEELQVASLAEPAAAVPSSGVSLEFREADVLEVLKVLAEKAGLNLVAGRNVTGQVTLFLKDVPVEDALEVVLVAGELAVERRGDILSVMPQRDYELLYGQPYRDRRVMKSLTPRHAKVADVSRALVQVKSNIGRVIADEATNTLVLMDTPELVQQMEQLVQTMDQPLVTRIYGLNYGTVKAFAPLLQEVVTRGVGRVSVDERTNKVAVTDYPARLDDVARLAEAFDERSLEVTLEARIVQITLSDKFQLGIDWEAFGQEHLTIKAPNALNLTSGGILKVLAPQSQGKDYKFLIEALRTYGDTKIISEPKLTVVSNQEAKILVGTKEPYVTTSVSQTGTGTAVTAESVNFIDVGIKLYVTPTITRDGYVQMKIRPEVSSKTGTLTTSEKNEIPIVETAEAETVMLIKDGETMLLGGLIKDEKSVDQQRIPFLGDIPVLGIPFRSSKETTKRTELVVVLTPRITSDRQEPLAAPAAPQPREKGLSPQGTVPFPGSPPPVSPTAFDPSAYEAHVAGLIQDAAGRQAHRATARGTVIVALTVGPDGRLIGSPYAVRSDDAGLTALALAAVTAAAPFPPPPREKGLSAPYTLHVAVTYE